ncbi:unnamed protein product [Caenorhabditis brenneri]
MEMLNQPTPTQHQHNISGADSIGDFIKQQQRQQPSQMSGPHQRPSIGSNILEQHAMNPATTGGDPSNRVFNDQQSSINGRLHQGNNLQMQHQSMMGVQQQHQQPNQMVSYNLVSEGSSGRLPPLTLKSSNFSTSNTVLLSNGTQCQMPSNAMDMSSVQQTQQMNHCEYDQNTITQNKVSPSMSMNEQLFDQHSLNSQQEMERQNRMNTPLQSHTDQHMVYTQSNQQNQSQIQYNGQGDMLQNQNSNHLTMNQFRSGLQSGNQMVSSFQSNQNSEQVSHLGHMDQQPPTQNSMNSVPQSQSQQRLGQLSCNSNQMSVQNQSPTNVSSSNISMNMNSSNSSFSMTPPNNNSNVTPVSSNSIPMNSNSTTQMTMQMNGASPMTKDQIDQINNMTTLDSEGSEKLLMPEPRLKQYTALKDMSTTDLRMECKKRSLPSAGTKIRLIERLSPYEMTVVEERNNKMMHEFTHKQQMYNTQVATLKAFQAKRAALQQAQNPQAGVIATPSNGTSNVMVNQARAPEGPPPKRKRIVKPKKPQEKQTTPPQAQNVITINSNQSPNMASSNGNSTVISTDYDTLLGRNTNQSSSNMGSSQNGSNVFGGNHQAGTTGIFLKDNSCFSHLGSGCRLISNNSSDDSQFNNNGRTFQNAAPPSSSNNSQMQFQSNDQLLYGGHDQISNQRNDAQAQSQSLQQSRPMNLNQQQTLGAQNMNQSISTMFNVSSSNNMHQQQQNMQQQNQNFMNAPQNGLQASPCVADQAGPSPNMPVSDPTATTSGSPVAVTMIATENKDAAELMDLETMQKLLSPATLRAREELLTQQQTRINELVNLIQKNHDTLREQQHQINLAKKQQKQRQRQNSQSAIQIDKHVNSRCIQHAIKSRQNFQMLTDLTKQQECIRTAETRLIEQLHINTATDDIARLIKQDGRTALVIVSLLHDYRQTREQNNRAKTSSEEPSVIEDKVQQEVVAKKKAPARKRNSGGGAARSNQNKKVPLVKQETETVMVQVMATSNNHSVAMHKQGVVQQASQQNVEFPKPQPPARVRTQSDVDMEDIFKTVIETSRNASKQSKSEIQHHQKQQQAQQQQQHQPQTQQTQHIQAQQQMDNEVVSLPSEVSSPMRTQSQNSVQSVYSDSSSYSRTMVYQQEESPQQMSYTLGTETESSCSPNEVHMTTNEMMQHMVMDSVSQQSDVVEILPQFEQTNIDYVLDNQQYHESMLFSEESNQEYVDNNCQGNLFDTDFPDIDQMVANMKDSNPLSCPLDDIDLNAILNCWTDESDSNQSNGPQHKQQNICNNMSYVNSNKMSQMNGDMDWDNFSGQSNIINQAFEQSQI